MLLDRWERSSPLGSWDAESVRVRSGVSVKESVL